MKRAQNTTTRRSALPSSTSRSDTPTKDTSPQLSAAAAGGSSHKVGPSTIKDLDADNLPSLPSYSLMYQQEAARLSIADRQQMSTLESTNATLAKSNVDLRSQVEKLKAQLEEATGTVEKLRRQNLSYEKDIVSALSDIHSLREYKRNSTEDKELMEQKMKTHEEEITRQAAEIGKLKVFRNWVRWLLMKTLVREHCTKRRLITHHAKLSSLAVLMMKDDYLKKQMVKKTGIAQWYKQSINMHELLSEKSNIWILDCDYLHEHLFDAEHVVTEGFKLMKQELLQQRQSTKTFFERNNILMNVCMKLEAQVEAAKNAGTTLRDKDNLLKEKMVDMSVSAFSPILIDEDESSSTLSRPSALDYLESPLPGSLPSSAPVLSAITASATSASATTIPTTIPTTTTSSLTTIASSPAPSLSSPSSSSFIVKENAAATRPSHTSTTLQEKVKPQSQGQPPPQQQQTFPAEGKQRGGNLETSDQWKFYPEPPKGDEQSASGTGIRKGRRVPKS